MAKDGYKCTKPEENFVGYLMQGYTQRKAYIKAFPNAKNLSYGVVSINAYNVLKKPNVRAYYDELRHNIQEQIIEDAIWTKEQAMSELKDILYKNKAVAKIITINVYSPFFPEGKELKYCSKRTYV